MGTPPLSSFRLPKRRPRARIQRQPDAQRLAYFSFLRPFLARMHERVTRELIPLLERRFPDALRTDAAPEDVKTLIAKLTAQTLEDMSPRKMRAIARQVANRTGGFQAEQLKTQLEGFIGVNPILSDRKLAAASEQFVARNTDLIRTLPTQYFGEIEKLVSEGVPAGRRAGDLAKDIEERFGVAESQAALIANTEVGQFYGELNRTRQEELGITEFEWVAVGDSRTRDTHHSFNGNVYRWDDPPADERLGGEKVIPGQAPNCRCTALPVFR